MSGIFVWEAVSHAEGVGSPLVGSRGEALVGVLGTKAPEAEAVVYKC